MALIELSDSKQNKLALVNRCLQSIGESPIPQGSIPSEFPLGSDAYVASTIVDDVWLSELNKGWWFNTENNFKVVPDDNSFISFPDTVLRIDSGRFQPYIKKNGMLYNKDTHSFIFTEPVYINIIWATSYSDLPIAAYEYLACRASRKFQFKIIGSPDQASMLMQEELEALSDLQRENNQYLDPSLLSTQVSNRYTNPYRGL